MVTGDVAAIPVERGEREATQARVEYGIKVVHAVTIRRPALELYQFWRDVPRLMEVIKHPATIVANSMVESHWSVSGPGGRRLEWDSVIINDEPGRLIAWQSKSGGDVDNAGTVRFEDAPGDEGTEVKVVLEYNPPGGKVGAAIAMLTRDSGSQQVYDTLRRFKALIEAGEIPTTDGQPVGNT